MRVWFTRETSPDMDDGDRRVLNTAVRKAFPPKATPSNLDLMKLRMTYRPGMSANDLLAAAGMDA